MASGEIIVNNLPANTSPTADDKVMVIRNADGELTNVTLDDIGDLLADPPEVFWVRYGLTSQADIEAAYQANKVVMMQTSGMVYRLTSRTSSTNHKFSAVSGSTIYTRTCSNGSWSSSTDSIPSASSSNPEGLGTASPGVQNLYSRADHVHPKPTAADLGITVPSASSATPQALGTAAAGSSEDYSRADHVHEMPDAEDVGAATPEDVYAVYPTDTASGAVASFPDGADGVPVKSLVADIAPVQSGSGDPAPDNVRPITGHTGVTVYDDAYYGGLIDWNQKAPALNTTNWKKVTSATWVTFTAADGTATVAIAGNKTSNTHIYPSTTPDVAGHVVYIRMDAKCTNPQSDQRATVLFFENASKAQTLISSAVSADWSTYETVATITVTPSQTRFYVSTGSNSDFSYYIKNPQIIDLTQMFGPGNEPTTLEAFHALFPAGEYAYSAGTETTVGAVRNDPGRNVSIAFPDPPGTVYGGTLDVTTGVLTVDKVSVDLGTLNWTYYTAGNNPIFYAEPSGHKAYANGEALNAICSCYAVGNPAAARSTLTSYLADKKFSWITGASGSFTVRDSSYTDKTTFTTAMNGQTLVYPLATPVTYQLTPTEVTALLGENNIWTDANGDVAVVYRADIQLYIQKLTGSTEEDMIADAPIASGKYFLVGNRLFLSTAAIAAGAKLTPGTNCTETNLAAALNAINS